MKKLFISTLTVVVFYNLGQTQEKTKKIIWSIQDCMEYAIENNLQIQQQKLDLENVVINEKDARNAFLPDLNIGANNNWVFGFARDNSGISAQRNARNSNYSINSNIPIYNGLQNYNRLQSVKLQKIAAQYNIESVKDDIRLNIANSYLQVLLQEENLVVLKAQNQITLEQIKRTQQLIDAGSLPKGDVLQLKATAAENIRRITENENDIVIAKIGLKQILRLNFNIPFKTKKIEANLDQLSLLNSSLDKILFNVISDRNEIKLAQQNIFVAEKQIEISRGNYMPRITGNINYGSSETSIENVSVPNFFEQLNNNKSFTVGLQLNIPIFNKFNVINNIKRNEVNVLRSKNQLEQIKQRLSLNVYRAYLNAQASNKSYSAAKVAVTAQKQAFEYAQNRFEVGISNSLDFTQARIAYQNSQTQLVSAKYDLLFKLKLLELYYGDSLQ